MKESSQGVTVEHLPYSMKSLRQIKLKKPDIQCLASAMPVQTAIKNPRYLSSKLQYEKETNQTSKISASLYSTELSFKKKSIPHTTLDLIYTSRANKIGSLTNIEENRDDDFNNPIRRNTHKSTSSDIITIKKDSYIDQTKFNEVFTKKHIYNEKKNSNPRSLNLLKTNNSDKKRTRENSNLEDLNSLRASNDFKKTLSNKKKEPTIVSFREAEDFEKIAASKEKSNSGKEATASKSNSIRNGMMRDYRLFLLSQKSITKLSKHLNMFMNEDDTTRVSSFNYLINSANEKGDSVLNTVFDAINENPEKIGTSKTVLHLDASSKTANLRKEQDEKKQSLFDRKITENIQKEFENNKIYSLVNYYADQSGIKFTDQNTGVSKGGGVKKNRVETSRSEVNKALNLRKTNDFRSLFQENPKKRLNEFPFLRQALEYKDSRDSRLKHSSTAKMHRVKGNVVSDNALKTCESTKPVATGRIY